MDAFFQARRLRWSAALLFAAALSAGAASHNVDFSIVLPEAERVDLLGSFNNWEASDDSRMENDNGRWRKTLALEEGTHEYYFQAAGSRIAGNGIRLDWKSPREIRKPRGTPRSGLVVPGDLEAFHARQQGSVETEAGIEVPLFYIRYADKDSPYRFGGGTSHALSTTPPAGDWTLPAFTGRNPLFATVELGDSRFLAVVDRRQATDPFYNRLILDQNGNGDLTDDPALEGESRTYSENEYFDCSFPAVDLDINAGGQTLPYSLALRVSGTMPGDTADAESLRFLRLGASPAGAYLAELALDGAAYRLALCDSTADGVFGTPAAIPPNTRYADSRLFVQGDTLYLSTADRVTYADGLLLGSHLVVGERLFAVQVDLARGRLLLQPWTGPAGTLALPAPVRSLTMINAAGEGGLMLAFTGEQIPVPAGQWRLLDYQILKKDEWGDEWLLQARGTDETPAVAVPAGGTTRLDAGEPLQAVVEISDRYLQRAVTNGSLRMSLGLVGNARERITDLRHVSGTLTQHKKSKRNSTRPEEAAYRIVKPDGELVFSGSFEYG